MTSTVYNGSSNAAGGTMYVQEPCQVPKAAKENRASSICGETDTLRIIEEFRKLYEEKLQKIHADSDDDGLQAKLNLQQDWIRDLTEQNTMLVKAIEELEQVATERVIMLEERLRQTADACGINMAPSKPQARSFPGQQSQFNQEDEDNENATIRLNHLQHDAAALKEVIRRAKEEGRWYTDGLQFYEISVDDVLGKDQTGKVQEPKSYKICFEFTETGVITDFSGDAEKVERGLVKQSNQLTFEETICPCCKNCIRR